MALTNELSDLMNKAFGQLGGLGLYSTAGVGGGFENQQLLNPNQELAIPNMELDVARQLQNFSRERQMTPEAIIAEGYGRLGNIPTYAQAQGQGYIPYGSDIQSISQSLFGADPAYKPQLMGSYGDTSQFERLGDFTFGQAPQSVFSQQRNMMLPGESKLDRWLGTGGGFYQPPQQAIQQPPAVQSAGTSKGQPAQASQPIQAAGSGKGSPQTQGQSTMDTRTLTRSSPTAAASESKPTQDQMDRPTVGAPSRTLSQAPMLGMSPPTATPPPAPTAAPASAPLNQFYGQYPQLVGMPGMAEREAAAGYPVGAPVPATQMEQGAQASQAAAGQSKGQPAQQDLSQQAYNLALQNYMASSPGIRTADNFMDYNTWVQDMQTPKTQAPAPVASASQSKPASGRDVQGPRTQAAPTQAASQSKPQQQQQQQAPPAASASSSKGQQAQPAPVQSTAGSKGQQ